MIKTSSEGIIYANATDVYESLKNISIWPEIFSPCQKIRVKERNENSELVEITALTKGKLFSWESKRIFNDKEMTIEFVQEKTAWPLSYMEGTWCVENHEDVTRVVLKHTFSIKWKYFNRIIGCIAKIFFVDANSNREIAGLKMYCERLKKNEISA